jgi:transposase
MSQSLEEKIPTEHLVRKINEAINNLGERILKSQYAGGGTSSYDPVMLLKVIAYGYCKKIYTSRKIAAALEEYIHFI